MIFLVAMAIALALVNFYAAMEFHGLATRAISELKRLESLAGYEVVANHAILAQANLIADLAKKLPDNDLKTEVDVDEIEAANFPKQATSRNSVTTPSISEIDKSYVQRESPAKHGKRRAATRNNGGVK